MKRLRWCKFAEKELRIVFTKFSCISVEKSVCCGCLHSVSEELFGREELGA